MLMTVERDDIDIPVAPADMSDICDTVARICADHPADYWRGLERQPVGDRFPQAFMTALAEAGMMGAILPEDAGGAGLPIEAAAAIVTTIHAAGADARMLIAQFEAAERLLAAGGTGATPVLQEVAEGGLAIYATALLEGTVRDGGDGGIVLDGTAARVSGVSASARILVVLPGGRGVALVEPSAVTASPLRELSNTNVWDIAFDGVSVPQDDIHGPGDADSDRPGTLRGILEAAAAVGDGRFFSRRGAQYANERVVFGSPIGSYQGIQFPLARAHVEVEAADIALRRAVALVDAGRPAGAETAVAHHLAMDAAWNMADAAFTTHGGFAFAREYDIERKWRDVRAARLAARPEAGDLRAIAEEALGLSAD